MKENSENIFKDKVLINNLSYLTALQIFSLLLPFITFPYLIRVLGKEVYGLVIFAQAIVAYFTIVINFGFNISATKDVSVHRDSQVKIAEIVSSVLIIKILLLLLSFCILSILVYSVPELRSDVPLYLLSFGICLYETIFPVWYFQGKEKMKYITYINIISKTVFTALIFILVRSQDDYLLVPALNLVGAFIAGVISIYILFYVDKIQFIFPKLSVIRQYILHSAPFFLSRATGIIILRTNIILIGSFFGYAEVAYYDLANKITEICKIPSGLINQTIFPRISVTKDMKMVVKVIKYNLVLSLILYFGVLLFANPIILILGGEELLPAKYIIFLLNITTPLVGISYFLGNTMLVVNGHYKPFNMSVIYQAIIYLILAALLILTNTHSIYTLAIIIVLSGIFETTYRYVFVKKLKII